MALERLLHFAGTVDRGRALRGTRDARGPHRLEAQRRKRPRQPPAHLAKRDGRAALRRRHVDRLLQAASLPGRDVGRADRWSHGTQPVQRQRRRLRVQQCTCYVVRTPGLFNVRVAP